MGAKKPISSNNSNGAREATVAKLFEEMRNGKQLRAKQREKMKACAEEAARGTPADSAIFRMKNGEEDEPQQSGVRTIPSVEERLKLRREQLVKTRAEQRAGLSRLKKTTMQAVQTIRETTLYCPGELRARLAEEAEGDPTGNADDGIVS